MTDPHSLYRLWSVDDALLYVGITSIPLEARFAQHRSKQKWWPEVTRHTVVEHYTREDLEAAEVAAIKSECPRYNVVHMDGIEYTGKRRGRPPLGEKAKDTEIHVRVDAVERAAIDRRRREGESRAAWVRRAIAYAHAHMPDERAVSFTDAP